MKKIKFLIPVMVIVCSCSVSKVERSARNTIDGNWILNDITYSSTGTFNIKMFNDIDASCLEGSNWFFRSNNSTGTYEVTNTGCPTGIRYIRWAAVETTKGSGSYDFTFKFTDENKRDLQKNTGYRLQLKYLDDNRMRLSQTVTFENKPFIISMNFNRKSY
ncbi:lipocalin [Leptobacterium sp. I13]|uniref:lipocalin n=1 Tax=Leptobacterium meishanense TaxID=3128904 RepID=UPI0030EF0E22